MEVLELQNLKKKDIPLHYRNEYSGTFILKSIKGQEKLDTEFVLERDAIGAISISIHFLSHPDYPILPLTKKIKTFILDLEKAGKL